MVAEKQTPHEERLLCSSVFYAVNLSDGAHKFKNKIAFLQVDTDLKSIVIMND